MSINFFVVQYEILKFFVEVELCVTGIHGYTVNDRLFTEPMNVDGEGNSICPACTRPRKEPPTPQSPGFVRYLSVDIPSAVNVVLHFRYVIVADVSPSVHPSVCPMVISQKLSKIDTQLL